jgi:molecular chaperone DnaJ
MAQDYYELLGVPRDASKTDIKKAFRGLARRYHPDVSDHEDAEARFKEINEAYAILSDDEKRARYDRYGHAGVNGQTGFGGGVGGFAGFEDIFDEFLSSFGGMGSRRRAHRAGPRPGQDRRMSVTIDFKEAAFGVEREVSFQRLEACDVCEGTGAEEGSEAETCVHCNGVGEVRQVQQTLLGSMVRVAACPHCGGKGKVIKDRCNNCDGSGRRRKPVKLNVKIPAGVHEGLQIRVPSEGDAGELGAPAGNLFLVINVKEHEYFVRREDDILLEIPINVVQATLGDKIIVPTVDGDVELSIPSGTQNGKVFRLRGKGFPRLRSDGSNTGRADQLVYVRVEIPTKLKPEQREAFEQLGEVMGGEIQPQPKAGFVDRVMNFFSGE